MWLYGHTSIWIYGYLGLKSPKQIAARPVVQVAM